MTLTTVDLFASALRFRPDGDVRAGARRMTDGDPGVWQVAAFPVETDADVHADHWETHPDGEEAVCCLSGGVRLYVRPLDEDGPEEDGAAAGGHRRDRAPGPPASTGTGRPERPDVDHPPARLPPGAAGLTVPSEVRRCARP
ncbi:hypothetical protein Srubr_77000 [Streptomyces rubradiris]|uniref:Uncharacterized protein n=1 Tax=Streptomyces rubradiris TaxID=285531 RepID=A0ABQ3RPS1_STRRR|nr:hypothetical protein GCM10018792_49510 [Streptomyces rubradiris]GHI57854.1 hypothetical protein Srubr_77000 [Streptomyces rubradiris]